MRREKAVPRPPANLGVSCRVIQLPGDSTRIVHRQAGGPCQVYVGISNQKGKLLFEALAMTNIIRVHPRKILTPGFSDDLVQPTGDPPPLGKTKNFNPGIGSNPWGEFFYRFIG